VGTRRSCIDDLPHVAPLLRSTLDEVLEQSEAVVVTNRNQEFDTVANRLQPDQVLIDLVRLPFINGHNYLGLSW
jgi:GDP-mannose 6-dehydrogenase